jgi:ethanolamine ammonia-lyase small subunit
MKPPHLDPWSPLRRLTPARIALGRTGSSLPTDALLEFSVAHAAARDAVYVALDVDGLRSELGALGYFCVSVRSAARERAEYLRRPDLGRRLDPESRERLSQGPGAGSPGNGSRVHPIVWVIADGLSANAARQHALPVMKAAVGLLGLDSPGPIVLATQARVALGDEIGELLDAEFVVMLLGERPGLSAPDSLGIYLTRAPVIGCTDAQRNCISNIRPEGLSYPAAAGTLARLIGGARRLGATGVTLKDEGPRPLLDSDSAR